MSVVQVGHRDSPIEFAPCPRPVLAGIVIVPLLIAYLAHLPNTRLYRIALWPVGLLCLVWGVLRSDLGYRAYALTQSSSS